MPFERDITTPTYRVLPIRKCFRTTWLKEFVRLRTVTLTESCEDGDEARGGPWQTHPALFPHLTTDRVGAVRPRHVELVLVCWTGWQRN